MQRSKLSVQQQQKSSSPKLDDAGGGGGMGKGIFMGGGGGDDDDDDDDDYEKDDGDSEDPEAEGMWWHKTPLAQLYDQANVRAVLSEWFMTVESLPGFLRMVASMQYYSTAQWVRYLTMQERPNLFRSVERALSRYPDARSGFVGRMLADPAFMQKTAIEGAIAFSFAMAQEVHVRGKRIKDEMDYALINAVCLAFGAAACSALVAPSKLPTPPSTKFPWQSMLNKLPNNVFEKNTPARSFIVPQRVSAFVAKGVELSAVSAIAGAASSSLQHCAVAARRVKDANYSPVTPVPGISRAAGGMGVFGGLLANTRLQAGSGLERVLLDYAKQNTALQVMGIATVFRAGTTALFENLHRVPQPAVQALCRAALQGQPTSYVPSPEPVRKMRKARKVRKSKSPEEVGESGFQISLARPSVSGR